MNTEITKVIKNTSFLYLRMVASMVLNFISTRLLLDSMGESDFGLYGVIGGSIAMLGFLTNSMSYVTQRYIGYNISSNDLEIKKKVFNSSLYIYRWIAILSFALYSIAGFILLYKVLTIPTGRELASIIIYISLILSTIYSILIVPYDASINAHEDLSFYALLGIFDVVMKFIISVLIYYGSFDKLIIYAILMSFEAWLVRLIAKKFCLIRYKECVSSRIKRKKYLDKNLIKEMVSFSGWNMLNVITGMISLYGTNIVLNSFWGTKVNAALYIATQLSGALLGVSSNLNKSLSPLIIRKEGEKNYNQVLNISYIGCRYSYLIFSFTCIPVIIWLDTILEVWLVEIPEYTYIFCIILLLSYMIEQSHSILFQSLLAKGDVKSYSVYRAISNVFPLILSSITFYYFNLLPYWGLLNWLVFYSIFGGIINILFSRKKNGLSIKAFTTKVLVPCLIVSFLSLSVIYTIKTNYSSYNIISNIFIILTSIFATIPIYFYFGLRNNDRKRFLSILPTKKTN